MLRLLTLRREQQILDQDLPTDRAFRPFKSDQLLVDEIVQNDFKLQELIVVKEWLQLICDDFETCEQKHSHLQSTIDNIVVRKRDKQLGVYMDSKVDIVTELDPDATNRQNKILLADDLDYEQQLNKTIFNFIRRNKMMEAIEFCQATQQYYKAATLLGGQLHFDPIDATVPTEEFDNTNVEMMDDGIKEQIGNQNKSLWKAVCLQLATDNRIDHYERAVYGALAGDLTSVLPVCKSWEDHLWAYFNGIIEYRIQKHLYKLSTQTLAKATAFELPVVDLNEHQVFERLLSDESLKYDGNEFYHLIQKHSILNDYGSLFTNCRKVIESSLSRLDQNFSLRFICHLILLWRNLGLDENEQDTEIILLKYIEYLVESKNGDLIPMFYEPLPRPIQTQGYATFLSNLTDDKTKYYNLGKSFHLNMMDICVETVIIITRDLLSAETTIDDCNNITFAAVDRQLTNEELNIISSLDWFTFEETQIRNLFEYSNKLLRKFLILGKLNCVKWIMDHYSLTSSEIDQGDWMVDPAFQTEQSDYFSLITCFELNSKWKELQSRKPKQE